MKNRGLRSFESFGPAQYKVSTLFLYALPYQFKIFYKFCKLSNVFIIYNTHISQCQRTLPQRIALISVYKTVCPSFAALAMTKQMAILSQPVVICSSGTVSISGGVAFMRLGNALQMSVHVHLLFSQNSTYIPTHTQCFKCITTNTYRFFTLVKILPQGCLPQLQKKSVRTTQLM